MKFVFDVAQCQILIRRFALANTLIAGQATADGISGRVSGRTGAHATDRAGARMLIRSWQHFAPTSEGGLQVVEVTDETLF